MRISSTSVRRRTMCRCVHPAPPQPANNRRRQKDRTPVRRLSVSNAFVMWRRSMSGISPPTISTGSCPNRAKQRAIRMPGPPSPCGILPAIGVKPVIENRLVRRQGQPARPGDRRRVGSRSTGRNATSQQARCRANRVLWQPSRGRRAKMTTCFIDRSSRVRGGTPTK